MTRTKQDRQKRQMNRRIREVVAVRRMMRQLDPVLMDPAVRESSTEAA